MDGIIAKYINHYTDVSGHFFMQWGTASGIILSGTGHTLRNSMIEKSAGNGVAITGTGHTILNNTFTDLTYAASDTSAVNTSTPGITTDHEISYNTIRRMGRSGITTRTFANSNAAGGKFKARMHHNNIAQFGLQDWDVGGFYIAVTDGGFLRIDHNLVSEGIGFTASGIYLDYSKNYVIDHNVVWNTEWGIKLHGQSLGVNNTIVFNNTASVINTSGVPYGPFGIGNGSGDNNGTILRNNILSNITPPAAPGYEPISLGRFPGADISNNLAWNGVANSGTDPKFINRSTALGATGTNYMIQSGSAAIDAGVVIGTTVRDNISVPPFLDPVNGTAPYLGAYEFGTPPWFAGASPTQWSLDTTLAI